jgi:hypothetical protein
MKRIQLLHTMNKGLRLAFVAGAAATLVSSTPAGAGEQKAAGASAKAAVWVPAPIPQSVFELPNTPADGKDPFFPKSRRPYANQGLKTPTTAPVVTHTLILNGLTGPPHRTCMINGQTFDIGEEANVNDSGVKVRIKCLEIRDNSVLIQLPSGDRRELHLSPGAAH